MWEVIQVDDIRMNNSGSVTTAKCGPIDFPIMVNLSNEMFYVEYNNEATFKQLVNISFKI